MPQQQPQPAPKIKQPEMKYLYDISGKQLPVSDFTTPYAVGKQLAEQRNKAQNQTFPFPYMPMGKQNRKSNKEDPYRPLGFASGGSIMGSNIDNIVNRKQKGTLIDLFRILHRG